MYTISDFFHGRLHVRPMPEYKCLIASAALDGIFSSCADYEKRKISFGLSGKYTLHICWLDGIVDGAQLAEEIIRPLTDFVRTLHADTATEVLPLISSGLVYSSVLKERLTMDEVVDDLTHGYCALVFDELHAALCFEAKNSAVRSVSEPTL